MVGIGDSFHGAAAAVGIDGKKVSSGPTPSLRGERIEETARVGGRVGGRRPSLVRGRAEKSFMLTAIST